MNQQKNKEPLLAVILSVVLPGLGQAYAHRIKRGLCFLVASVFANLAMYFIVSKYIFDPHIQTTMLLLICSVASVVVSTGIWIYNLIDAYRCVTYFNSTHDVTYEPKWYKRLLFMVCFYVALNLSVINYVFSYFITLNPLAPFKVTSDVMHTALLENDYILVELKQNEFQGFDRGDVVVFQSNTDKTEKLIMRLVAFENEEVSLRDGRLYINGVKVADPVISHIHYDARGSLSVGQTIRVPEGHFFVLGDHSVVAADSRYIGPIPEANMIGKVVKVYWPMSRSGVVR